MRAWAVLGGLAVLLAIVLAVAPVRDGSLDCGSLVAPVQAPLGQGVDAIFAGSIERARCDDARRSRLGIAVALGAPGLFALVGAVTARNDSEP